MCACVAFYHVRREVEVGAGGPENGTVYFALHICIALQDKRVFKMKTPLIIHSFYRGKWDLQA